MLLLNRADARTVENLGYGDFEGTACLKEPVQGVGVDFTECPVSGKRAELSTEVGDESSLKQQYCI